MTHPNSLALEAFACGELADSVAAHLRECAACSAFVERLRGALSAGPSRARAADVVARAAARLEAKPEIRTVAAAAPASPATARARRRWLMTASTVAMPLAAAAVLLFLVRTPSTRGSLVPLSTPTTATSTPTETNPDPETRFKGGVQVAVIRERAGQQSRFAGHIDVRPGDRLRVEVALDREQAILAAVMGDDGSWLELMSGGVRRPGTHFSDRSARVDASPLHGTILVGSPEAVARAQTSRRFDEVTAIRVEWEAP